MRDVTPSLLRVGGIIAVIVAGIYMTVQRFIHIDMTNTRLFVTFWQWELLGMAGVLSFYLAELFDA